VILNILGLGVGKWLNNLGAIGTFVAPRPHRLGSCDLAAVRHVGTMADFRVPANPRFVLELLWRDLLRPCGSGARLRHGDEIESPQKTLPGAVAWGGLLLRFALHRSDPDSPRRRQQK